MMALIVVRDNISIFDLTIYTDSLYAQWIQLSLADSGSHISLPGCHFVFKLLNRRSIGALSQPCPPRLMLWVMDGATAVAEIPGTAILAALVCVKQHPGRSTPLLRRHSRALFWPS